MRVRSGGRKALYTGAMGSAEEATGWWVVAGKTCVAAYQPKGAASLVSSYINLVNPGTYNASPGVAPTWDETNGWKFANTQYLVTGVVPDASYSMIFRFSNTSGDKFIIGAYGGDETRFFCKCAGNWGVGTYEAGSVVTSGIGAIADLVGYYSGSSDSVQGSWSGTNTEDIYIGMHNQVGSPYGTTSSYFQEVAIYSDVLTPSEVSALTTVIAAL